MVKIRVVEHSGESRKGIRKRTNRELPQGGREQEKLGGLNTLPLKSITLWEAHQGGWGPVGRLRGERGEESEAAQRNTPPAPPPPASSQHQSADAHSAHPLISDFPGNPTFQAVWERCPFPIIVPVPSHHSSEARPAWQPPHPCSCAAAPPARTGPGLRKSKQLIRLEMRPSGCTWPH